MIFVEIVSFRFMTKTVGFEDRSKATYYLYKNLCYIFRYIMMKNSNIDIIIQWKLNKTCFFQQGGYGGGSSSGYGGGSGGYGGSSSSSGAPHNAPLPGLLGALGGIGGLGPMVPPPIQQPVSAGGGNGSSSASGGLSVAPGGSGQQVGGKFFLKNNFISKVQF